MSTEPTSPEALREPSNPTRRKVVDALTNMPTVVDQANAIADILVEFALAERTRLLARLEEPEVVEAVARAMASAPWATLGNDSRAGFRIMARDGVDAIKEMLTTSPTPIPEKENDR